MYPVYAQAVQTITLILCMGAMPTLDFLGRRRLLIATMPKLKPEQSYILGRATIGGRLVTEAGELQMMSARQ